MTQLRPFPPEHLAFEGVGGFEPAPELLAWARSTFIAEGAALHNHEHAHLEQAKIGFLWTNEPNERRGRMVLGQCQFLPPSGDKWSVGARILQLTEWFMEMPDFLITIYAPAAAELDEISFCALVEHELFHAGQKHDARGQPIFNRETGEPVWAIKPHDVEEHLGIVRRYGAWSPELKAMAEAIIAGPEIARASIEIACGTCARVLT